jgi:hypothetical protein
MPAGRFEDGEGMDRAMVLAARGSNSDRLTGDAGGADSLDRDHERVQPLERHDAADGGDLDYAALGTVLVKMANG